MLENVITVLIITFSCNVLLLGPHIQNSFSSIIRAFMSEILYIVKFILSTYSQLELFLFLINFIGRYYSI